MSLFRATGLTSLCLCLLAACTPKTDAGKADAKKEASPAAKDATDETTKAASSEPAEGPSSSERMDEQPHIKAEPAPPLTEEEKALIAKDPKDLTPDQRRARAYALRKKIMQNPDSPTAQSLLRTAERMRREGVVPPANNDAKAADPAASETPSK